MRGLSGCAPVHRKSVWWADGQRPAARMSAWGREQPEPRQGPGPHLRGLTLLLELLQLLGREEADRLVARDELRTRRHGSKDDVAAQPTEAVGKRREARPRPGDLRPGLTGPQSEIPPFFQLPHSRVRQRPLVLWIKRFDVYSVPGRGQDGCREVCAPSQKPGPRAA